MSNVQHSRPCIDENNLIIMKKHVHGPTCMFVINIEHLKM